MHNDKQKLLMIMRNLESDYRNGKISVEKYRYFRSKYEDKLNALDAKEATSRIRSMQGKSQPKNVDLRKRPTKDPKREEQDLVQKYIINPKKGDKNLSKKQKKPMDSSSFKLFAVLVLVIGFAVGIGFGIFTFDFGNMSVTAAEATVEDTAFPVDEINVTNTTDSNSSSESSGNEVDTSYDSSSGSTDYSQDYNSGGSAGDGSGGSSGGGSAGDGSGGSSGGGSIGGGSEGSSGGSAGDGSG
ncbi:endoglucanase [Methanobrevibacter woesei]|uniref:endoglucanase n=1 Tax=Methanobrevibacter woesei TaxID=190976 RepID=UPI0026DEAFF9|nr:endoglucanase [Methanobrevibacter woesei]